MHQYVWTRFLLVAQEADTVDVGAVCGAVETLVDLLNAYVIEDMMSADAFRELWNGQLVSIKKLRSEQ